MCKWWQNFRFWLNCPCKVKRKRFTVCPVGGSVCTSHWNFTALGMLWCWQVAIVIHLQSAKAHFPKCYKYGSRTTCHVNCASRFVYYADFGLGEKKLGMKTQRAETMSGPFALSVCTASSSVGKLLQAHYSKLSFTVQQQSSDMAVSQSLREPKTGCLDRISTFNHHACEELKCCLGSWFYKSLSIHF